MNCKKCGRKLITCEEENRLCPHCSNDLDKQKKKQAIFNAFVFSVGVAGFSMGLNAGRSKNKS